MRFVTTEESKKEYKEFLEKNDRCNFQQSLEWAEVKKPNWKSEVILAEDEDGVVCRPIIDGQLAVAHVGNGNLATLRNGKVVRAIGSVGIATVDDAVIGNHLVDGVALRRIGKGIP